VTDVRTTMESVMDQTVADEVAHFLWTYLAVRPEEVVIWHAGEKVKSDCSTGARIVSRTSGGPDPMGLHYAPYGNSTTACAHLHHLDNYSDLEVGDYVTMGYLGQDHMTVVRKKGNTPQEIILWSDGGPDAPNFYALAFDTRPHQLLRNPVANPIETPAEKLRAKTGFHSWAQWRTGRGPWVTYGKRNKRVRPNVRKRVPVRWWAMLAHQRWLLRKRRTNGIHPLTPKGKATA
jgi:hypothetical protein